MENVNGTNNPNQQEDTPTAVIQENPAMDNNRGAIWSGPEKALTFGEMLVGVSFNPSADPNVTEAKRLCAALADLVEQNYKNHDSTNLGSRLFEHAIGEILNAQMVSVKCLTLTH